jgi:small subunit ribosomal protein S23
MRADFIKKEPAWFKAVLEHPPLPLPPKAPPPRSAYDLPPQKNSSSSALPVKMRAQKPRPLPIHYVEDDVRRQFFRDHPFEAFRPTTLVEGAGIEDSHPIKGQAWIRLRQRGRNPSPEDAIRFAVNLYHYHHIPLSQAYARAISQFRSLRSEHHIATTFAALEAEAYGAKFGPTEIESGFEKEKESLKTFERREELDEGAMAARKRWRAIVEKQGGVGQWTKGEEYVRLWKQGIRPTYAPGLTEPVITSAGLSQQEIAESPDYFNIRPLTVG